MQMLPQRVQQRRTRIEGQPVLSSVDTEHDIQGRRRARGICAAAGDTTSDIRDPPASRPPLAAVSASTSRLVISSLLIGWASDFDAIEMFMLARKERMPTVPNGYFGDWFLAEQALHTWRSGPSF